MVCTIIATRRNTSQISRGVKLTRLAREDTTIFGIQCMDANVQPFQDIMESKEHYPNPKVRKTRFEKVLCKSYLKLLLDVIVSVIITMDLDIQLA